MGDHDKFMNDLILSIFTDRQCIATLVMIFIIGSIFLLIINEFIGDGSLLGSISRYEK